MKKLVLACALLVPPVAISWASGSLPPSGSLHLLPPVWPCNGEWRCVHDNPKVEEYQEELPGGAWNEAAAEAMAAVYYHGSAICDDECDPPEGCVKEVDTDSVDVTYISGPDPNGVFTYEIEGLEVYGRCTDCPEE